MGCLIKEIFGVCLLVYYLIGGTFACVSIKVIVLKDFENPLNLTWQQGHKLKVHYIRNCGDAKTNVIQIQENSTISLNADCEIIPNTCVETTGFKTASIQYQIWKNNLPIMRNTVDACEAANKLNPDNKAMMKLFGIPTKCPIEKVRQIFFC